MNPRSRSSPIPLLSGPTVRILNELRNDVAASTTAEIPAKLIECFTKLWFEVIETSDLRELVPKDSFEPVFRSMANVFTFTVDDTDKNECGIEKTSGRSSSCKSGMCQSLNEEEIDRLEIMINCEVCEADFALLNNNVEDSYFAHTQTKEHMTALKSFRSLMREAASKNKKDGIVQSSKSVGFLKQQPSTSAPSSSGCNAPRFPNYSQYGIVKVDGQYSCILCETPLEYERQGGSSVANLDTCVNIHITSKLHTNNLQFQNDRRAASASVPDFTSKKMKKRERKNRKEHQSSSRMNRSQSSDTGTKSSVGRPTSGTFMSGQTMRTLKVLRNDVASCATAEIPATLIESFEKLWLEVMGNSKLQEFVPIDSFEPVYRSLDRVFNAQKRGIAKTSGRSSLCTSGMCQSLSQEEIDRVEMVINCEVCDEDFPLLNNDVEHSHFAHTQTEKHMAAIKSFQTMMSKAALQNREDGVVLSSTSTISEAAAQRSTSGFSSRISNASLPRGYLSPCRWPIVQVDGGYSCLLCERKLRRIEPKFIDTCVNLHLTSARHIRNKFKKLQNDCHPASPWDPLL